jgi:hypothetical protein
MLPAAIATTCKHCVTVCGRDSCGHGQSLFWLHHWRLVLPSHAVRAYWLEAVYLQLLISALDGDGWSCLCCTEKKEPGTHWIGGCGRAQSRSGRLWGENISCCYRVTNPALFSPWLIAWVVVLNFITFWSPISYVPPALTLLNSLFCPHSVIVFTYTA